MFGTAANYEPSTPYSEYLPFSPGLALIGQAFPYPSLGGLSICILFPLVRTD